MSVRYEKACECTNATASGPRQVITSMTDDPNYARGENGPSDGRFIATVENVRLACDRCNTPWRRVADIDRALSTPEQPTLVLSDAELEEIRERNEGMDLLVLLPGSGAWYAHRDRATLLQHVATLQHQLALHRETDES